MKARGASRVFRGGRRGYALPLVAVLAIIAGIGIAVLIERQATINRTVRRQINAYIEHHTGTGTKELVNAWLGQSTGAVDENLDLNGGAFRVELPGNWALQVRIEDGQGTLLSNATSLPAEEREIVQTAARRLELATEGRDATRYFRQAGPAAVSLMSAPREVLEAVIGAVVGPDAGARIAESVITERETGGRLTMETLSRLYQRERIEPETAEIFGTILTTRPTVWKVTADHVEGGRRIARREEGLVEITGRVMALSADGLVFLSWREVEPVED